MTDAPPRRRLALTLTIAVLAAATASTYVLARLFPPTFALTPWDHAALWAGFVVSDGAIAYFFVKVINPPATARFVNGKVKALLAEERATLISELVPALVKALTEALTPPPEAQQAQTAAAAETIKAAVQEAAQTALSGNMKSLSARGVDSRTTFAALEEEFMQAVLAHEKGGIIAASFAEWLSGSSPKVYKAAVRAGADGVASFLEKNGARIQEFAAKLGLADKPSAKTAKLPGLAFA